MKNKKKNQRIYALCLAVTLTAGSIIPGYPGKINTLKAEFQTENPEQTIYEQRLENSNGNDRESKNYLVVMKDEAAYEKMEKIMEAEQEALEEAQKKILPNLPIEKIAEQQTEEENACREELLEETDIMVRTMTDTQAEKLGQNKNIEYIEEDVECTGSEESEGLSAKKAEAICQIVKDKWNKKAINIPEAKSTEDTKNTKNTKNTEEKTDAENKANTAPKTQGKSKKKIAILDSGTAITADIDIQERIHLVEEEASYLCEDLTGHGTAVASILAAKDNGEGTSGIDENLEIYSVTVLDENNSAPVSRIIAGLQWCIENDIDIINMSFGTPTYSKALESKIQEAADKGMLLIAAAGNNGTEKNSVEYPAAYDEVIAVGSINATMKRAEHSAQGEAIELMAPGENVPIESLLGATTIGSGTSYAAPHVTAVAALLWQEEPDWKSDKIRALLQAGARKLEEENSGYGLIDYPYTKSIQSDFDTTYERKDKESAVRTYSNEEELEEYEMPKVVANWTAGTEKKNGHDQLISMSLGKKTEAWQKDYTTAKINALQKVSLFLDKNGTTHGISELHAGGYTNYVAATAYLYELAVLKWQNPNKSIYTLQKDLPNQKVITALSMTKEGKTDKKYEKEFFISHINKGIEIVFQEDKDIKSISGLSKGQDHAVRLLGMALHVAGDAYAHKAMISATAWNSKRSEVEKFFEPAELTAVDTKVKNKTLTTAKIASEISNTKNKKDCHGATADNPEFLPNRYRYGAQHAVTALLRGYSKETAKCYASVFYGDGKNKIKQYHIYTYIMGTYSISTKEEKEKWQKISGAD